MTAPALCLSEVGCIGNQRISCALVLKDDLNLVQLHGGLRVRKLIIKPSDPPLRNVIFRNARSTCSGFLRPRL